MRPPPHGRCDQVLRRSSGVRIRQVTEHLEQEVPRLVRVLAHLDDFERLEAVVAETVLRPRRGIVRHAHHVARQQSKAFRRAAQAAKQIVVDRARQQVIPDVLGLVLRQVPEMQPRRDHAARACLVRLVVPELRHHGEVVVEVAEDQLDAVRHRPRILIVCRERSLHDVVHREVETRRVHLVDAQLDRARAVEQEAAAGCEQRAKPLVEVRLLGERGVRHEPLDEVPVAGGIDQLVGVNRRRRERRPVDPRVREAAHLRQQIGDLPRRVVRVSVAGLDALRVEEAHLARAEHADDAQLRPGRENVERNPQRQVHRPRERQPLHPRRRERIRLLVAVLVKRIERPDALRIEHVLRARLRDERRPLPVEPLVELNVLRARDVPRHAVHEQLFDGVPFPFAEREEQDRPVGVGLVLEDHVPAHHVPPVSQHNRFCPKRPSECPYWLC